MILCAGSPLRRQGGSTTARLSRRRSNLGPMRRLKSRPPVRCVSGLTGSVSDAWEPVDAWSAEAVAGAFEG